MSSKTARQLGLPEAAGALIAAIDPGSDAFRESNLRSRMVIVQADGQTVTGVRDFEQIYQGVAPGSTFLVRARLPGKGSGTTLETALTRPSR